MSSEETKHLKDQIRILDHHIKLMQNQLYILQGNLNDVGITTQSYKMEITKQQNQIASLATLLLDIVKDNRHIEEVRENYVLQKINNIFTLDTSNADFNVSLSNATGQAATGTGSTVPNGPGGPTSSGSTDNLSSLTGLTLNPSSTNASSANQQLPLLTANSNQSSNGSISNLNNNNISFLNPNNRVNSNDQNLLTPSSNQYQQQLQQQMIQPQQRQLQSQQSQSQGQLQQQSLAAIQQNFQQEQQQRQQSQMLQQQQQQHLHQQQHHQSQSSQQQKARKSSKRRNTNSATATDAAALLADDPLGGFTTQATPQQNKPQQIRPSLSGQSTTPSMRQIPIAINPNSTPDVSQDNNDSEVNKRRKVYDKDYAFIKAPSSVEEIWNEYSVGLNNQPSIKQLEEEYKTGWRRDPATSKKFNRRKAIYRAIEKGLEKGYSLQNCIQLLEDYRFIDREKNLKQPIGWLCHGNLPEELK